MDDNIQYMPRLREFLRSKKVKYSSAQESSRFMSNAFQMENWLFLNILHT